MNKQLLTVEQVAELLNISKSIVRRYLRDGRLVGSKINENAWRVDPDDLQRFIAERRNVS